VSVAITNLTAQDNGSNLATYTTASISPVSNALLLCAVLTTLVGTPPAPTVSGLGLTWTTVANCFFRPSNTQYRLDVYRALGTPTPGSVTLDYGGVAQAGATWVIDQVTGVATTGLNGSDAVLQTAISPVPSTSVATRTIALNSAIQTGNVPWAVTAWGVAEAGTGEAGWTVLANPFGPGPGKAVLSQWRNGTDDLSATATWTTAGYSGAVILELGAPAAGGGGQSGARTQAVWVV
jgi:hypothetical protein